MPIDPGNVIANLNELRALTADENGAQRLAWSPVWMKAREWFAHKLKGLPVEYHFDAAGNRWITLRGKSEKVLVIGSHLDSVPNGGWLDGCLGVVTGLEVLRALSADYGSELSCTIRLVDWADEEGARFGRSLFGSAAFAGKSTIAADRERTDRDGVTLAAALDSCGVDIDRVDEAMQEQANIAAYLELHIEQGPVLEDKSQPLAAVLGTKGVERHVVTFYGQEAHSGSTPMAARRDALAAASRLALEIRSIARQHADAVCTMGSVKTYPGIVTAVVGRCEVTLDQRDLSATVLTSMLLEAREASKRFAAEEGCTVVWSKIWSIEPIPFHAELIELCEEAIQEVTGISHRMPSGPLHDAAEVARLGVPTAMMFVQSLGGISHNKIEDTRIEDLRHAVFAFDRLVAKTLLWIKDCDAADS
jgi:N-carbamoyl-L-amino-acid hydrolase